MVHPGVDGDAAAPPEPGPLAGIVLDCEASAVKCYVKQASHRYPGRQGDIPAALWACKEVPW